MFRSTAIVFDTFSREFSPCAFLRRPSRACRCCSTSSRTAESNRINSVTDLTFPANVRRASSRRWFSTQREAYPENRNTRNKRNIMGSGHPFLVVVEKCGEVRRCRAMSGEELTLFVTQGASERQSHGCSRSFHILYRGRCRQTVKTKRQCGGSDLDAREHKAA